MLYYLLWTCTRREDGCGETRHDKIKRFKPITRHSPYFKECNIRTPIHPLKTCSGILSNHLLNYIYGTNFKINGIAHFTNPNSPEVASVYHWKKERYAHFINYYVLRYFNFSQFPTDFSRFILNYFQEIKLLRPRVSAKFTNESKAQSKNIMGYLNFVLYVGVHLCLLESIVTCPTRH